MKDLSAKVAEIMTRRVVTIGADRTVSEAIRKMVENNIECLVICGRDRKVRGIITVQDLLKKILYKEGDASKVKVRDIMSSPVVTCKKDTNLLEVVKLMKSRRIRRIPITDSSDRLLGLVTTFDLALFGWDISV